MIRATAVIHCDLCYEQYGPTFCSEWHAQQWSDDRAEDYEEYGPFADNVPRFSEIFHKIGGKLACKRCVEREIQKTKAASK